MVVVTDVHKKYKKKQVLCGVNFSAQSGDLVAIVGRNGCGKSTLLKILAGVLKTDVGTIAYFDKEVQNNTKSIHKYCGYVPQENPLFEELTVLDNLKFWGANATKDKQKQVIEQFQLQELLSTPVDKLSGGMKRRLAIACAMQEWPPILLLDEPTTALDTYYKASIWEFLRMYLDMQGIIIMSTHDKDEIQMATKCYKMMDGRLIEEPC